MMMRWVILSACAVALVSFAQADPPENYYTTITGKTGRELRSALHNIIDDHRVIKYSSKNPDTADALAELDADPKDSDSVILIYSRRSEAISNFGTSSGWNREHLWCNSYGIDKRGPAYSDLHNLKPADASVNSARSNKIFDTSDTSDAKYQKPGHAEAKLTSEDTDSWEPPTEVRGEIARAAFYMDVRYSGDKANENDLQLTNDLSAISSDTVFFGNLDTLLEWHIADPVDAAERTRNDLVYSGLPEEQKSVCGLPRVGGGDLRQRDERAVCLEPTHNRWRESPVCSEANSPRPIPASPEHRLDQLDVGGGV
jgi:endonuclease I